MEAQAKHEFQSDLPVKIIEVTGLDALRYVKDAWMLHTYSMLDSALFLSRQGPKPQWDIFQALFPMIQEKVLAKSKVLVAENTERPGQYLGCLVYQPAQEATATTAATPPIIHFCCTKKQVWEQGIAKTILMAASIDYRQSDFIYTLSSPIIRKFNLGRTIDASTGEVTKPGGIYVPFWLLG